MSPALVVSIGVGLLRVWRIGRRKGLNLELLPNTADGSPRAIGCVISRQGLFQAGARLVDNQLR